jgi:signal transduction histidine kinase
MKIRLKIVIPLLILLIIIITALGLSTYFLNQNRNAINTLYINFQALHNSSNQILYLYNENEKETLRFLGNKDNTHIDRIRDNQNEIEELLDTIEKIGLTDESLRYLQGYKVNREKLIYNRELLFKSINEGNDQETELLLKKIDLITVNGLANLYDFTNYNINRLEKTTELSAQLITRLQLILFFLIIFTTILIILLYNYLRIMISIPIISLSKTAENISQGRFSDLFNYHSDDELGELAKSLKRMSVSLRSHYNLLEAEIIRKEIEIKRSKEFEEQKDNFISIASHELKTPITSLKIFHQILSKELQNDKQTKYEKYMTKLNEQMNKLMNLVTGLLDISRIQQGRLEYSFHYFDINKLIESNTEVMKELTNKHSFVIKGKVKKEVFGDKERISQVIDNVLANAVKYSPKGGIIITTLKDCTDKVEISIKDFGIGIEKKDQEKIFEKFFRVNDYRHKTYPGLGIGLYLSSEIIKSHGGEIWVESEKGRGSIFTFTIPNNSKNNLYKNVQK